MTLRTKIEEAIGERHVHKIDNAELLDQICTIFEEELIEIVFGDNELKDRGERLLALINSLEGEEITK